MQTVSLSLFRFASVTDRLWAFVQMGLARSRFAATRDIGFWKLCGSGTGEGFTPVPNTAVYAVLASWPSPDTARLATAKSDAFRRYRYRARESWTVFLSPVSVRGHWTGKVPFTPDGSDADALSQGPLAALTRATVRPRAAAKFWKRVPDISKVIGADPNVAFKIGIGEVPMLHQVTFSIWPDAASMANFARRDGPHARAIAAVRDEGWFREELYARFRVLDSAGSWEGGNPLSKLAGLDTSSERTAA